MRRVLYGSETHTIPSSLGTGKDNSDTEIHLFFSLIEH